MKRRTVAASAGMLVALAAATIWGLTVSVVASRPAARTVLVPGDGFGPPVGASRTVLRASWGSGPGEIGISYEGETRGATSFGLDDRERIYVLDGVNERIVRFAGGQVDAAFPLPGPDFEDLVVARDRVIALARSGDRRLVVIDTTDGTSAEVPIDERVPAIHRLVVSGPWVYAECPDPSGRNYHRLVSVDGTAARPDDQARVALTRTPLPNGDSLKLARSSLTEIAFDVERSGTTRANVRARSRRQVGAVLDATSDRFGNLFITWGLTAESNDGPDPRAARLLVTRHAPTGELTGRIESPRDDHAEPVRKTVVTETGELYELVTTRTGVEVRRWSFAQ